VTRLILALGASVLVCGIASAQAVQVEADIKPYKKASGVSGNLSSIGSDTLNNLMTLWAEGFKKAYPSVNVQIEGKGSSTAPPALISGTAQLGPMSRLMKPEELDGFEKHYGYKPTPIRVAVDGLAVFVNKDNPLTELTMPQVDAIFGKTRKGGATDDIASSNPLSRSASSAFALASASRPTSIDDVNESTRSRRRATSPRASAMSASRAVVGRFMSAPAPTQERRSMRRVQVRRRMQAAGWREPAPVRASPPRCSPGR